MRQADDGGGGSGGGSGGGCTSRTLRRLAGHLTPPAAMVWDAGHPGPARGQQEGLGGLPLHSPHGQGRPARRGCLAWVQLHVSVVWVGWESAMGVGEKARSGARFCPSWAE